MVIQVLIRLTLYIDRALLKSSFYGPQQGINNTVKNLTMNTQIDSQKFGIFFNNYFFFSANFMRSKLRTSGVCEDGNVYVDVYRGFFSPQYGNW